MLPNMKYNGGASRGQSIVFKGLNLSDTATEGELIACTNLSARRFPHLSARGGRTRKGKYEKATAAFLWNGHEIVAEGGKLLYDGVALCNCNAEPKQFAVVNTKLVVWPDKLIIDMTDKTFQKLDAIITNNGDANIKSDSISFMPRKVYGTLVHEAIGQSKEGVYLPWMWTYEKVHWDSVEKKWELEGKTLTSMENCRGRYYIPNISVNDVTGEHIVDLPKTMFPENYGEEVTEEQFPEPSGNNQGFYCEITSSVISNYIPFISNFGRKCTQNINIYLSAEENDSVEENFSVGDSVNIGGSLYGLIVGKSEKIMAVDNETNTLTFESNSLRPVKCVYEFKEDFPNLSDGVMNVITIKAGSVIFEIEYESENGWKKGDVICVETDAPSVHSAVEGGEYEYSAYLWKPDELRAETFWRCDAWIDYEGRYEYSDVPEMEDYNPGRLTVQRVAYDFDYICEKDNRLWGVCNRQKDSADGARGRLIFASALGDPTTFDEFKGLSTDSWQVAVAGDGDFTACCNYGDCVLFFKEDKIYKVAGDLPEQYTLYPYNVAGVQEGSYKSLVNINETLLYKGVNGVYAYGGAVPSLVSSALGRKKYYDACAGSDGIVYYISMRNDGGYHLFTYDTLTGIWLREDDTEAADFCFSTGDLLMLTGGKLYLINGEADTDDGTPIEWSAELASFNEATDHNRRSYSRLLLRTSMKNLKTDSVSVYVSNTSGRWDPCTKKNLSVGDYVIPLKPNRDNDLRIKIEGKSPDMVLSLAREYIGGSELGGVK